VKYSTTAHNITYNGIIKMDKQDLYRRLIWALLWLCRGAAAIACLFSFIFGVITKLSSQVYTGIWFKRCGKFFLAFLFFIYMYDLVSRIHRIEEKISGNP